MNSAKKKCEKTNNQQTRRTLNHKSDIFENKSEVIESQRNKQKKTMAKLAP